MRLIQISAWNDSGGGFTHRLFDGHPGLRAWPYELLLGRDQHPVDDFGEDWFRGRFRWPRFGAVAEASGAALFDAIADSELKAVLSAPATAKHRDFPISVSMEAWRAEVDARWFSQPLKTQAAFLTLYMESLLARLGETDETRPVLGHCPIAILDAPEMWADFPDARMIHVVRSPFEGFCSIRDRHPNLDPAAYARKWSLINGAAALWRGKAPERIRLIALSDLVHRRRLTMESATEWLDLDMHPVLLAPTWRGRPLDEERMGPFGGVATLDPVVWKARCNALPTKTLAQLDRGTAAVVDLLRSAGLTTNSLDHDLTDH